MRPTHPYFDLKEHLRIVRRQVMPIFFLLCALVMVLVIVQQAGQKGEELPQSDALAPRIGLHSARPGAVFDPAFAVFSPTEMVLAPEAVVFDPPRAPLAGLGESGEEIRAAADGRVVFAGESAGGQTVVLIHERQGQIVETVYSGLGSIRVAVAGQVRRSDVIGTVTEGKGDTSRFERRHFPALAVEAVPGESGDLPEDWRGRSPDRLSAPPGGEPIETSALKLEAGKP